MTDPTANPAFSGIKLPVFDDLVTSHTRAAPALEQLAHDLWAELNKLGVDTSPALRIRTLAQRLHSHSTELQRRQRQVHELQQGGGTQHCTTSGIFWELKEVSLPTPSPQPGQPPPDLAELSYELMSANLLPRRGRLRADGTPFSRAEDAVLSWMEVYRETILQEAARWRISPKAIVAAIAWEAIDNPQPFRHPIPAGSGLGRIHPGSPAGQPAPEKFTPTSRWSSRSRPEATSLRGAWRSANRYSAPTKGRSNTSLRSWERSPMSQSRTDVTTSVTMSPCSLSCTRAGT